MSTHGFGYILYIQLQLDKKNIRAKLECLVAFFFIPASKQ